ncbi:MAG: hypothetical protein ACK4QL_11780 [Pseudanabaenaceae cyanobacterium]
MTRTVWHTIAHSRAKPNGSSNLLCCVDFYNDRPSILIDTSAP